FRQEDFASLHPGGKIGKRLMRVEALMHAGKQCPMVRANTRMRDVIYEMSSKGLGMTCVIDGEEETLLGIITDGDLRRRMEGDGAARRATRHHAGPSGCGQQARDLRSDRRQPDAG